MKYKSAYVMHLASLLMFGMNGIVASRIALNSYEIVLTRTCIGSVFLLALFLLSRQKARLFHEKRHALYLCASGVAMGASWMFLYEAYRQVGVGIATLTYYSGPVIVMMLSPVLFREKLTASKIAGFIAVLFGMAFVNAQALGSGESARGLLCGILSALTYALMVIFNKKASRITGLENAAWQLLTAFITVAAFVGFKQGFTLKIPALSWPYILLLGVLNTGIGCYFYFSSIGKLPVQTVAVCGYLEPLSAVAFAALLLHERMTPLQLAGAALILGGVAFAELYVPKREKPRRAVAR